MIGADGTIYIFIHQHDLFAVNPDGTLYIDSMHSSPGFNGRLWALTTKSMGYAASSWPRFRHGNKNTGRFGAD